MHIDSETIYVHYFAQFQEESGKNGEAIAFNAVQGETADEWYRYLADRYAFSLDRDVVRAAVNGRYASWDAPVRGGDEIAFIPPVAGG